MLNRHVGKTFCGVAAGTLLAVGAATTAHGVVIADFNDLNPGAVSGQAGGEGFAGAWGGSSTIDAVDGDLTSDKYTLTQTGTGQSLQGSYNSTRYVFAEMDEAMAGDVWFSVLIHMPTSTARAGLMFNGTSPSGTTGTTHSILFLGTLLRAQSGGSANRVDVEDAIEVGRTFLLVGNLNTDEGTLKFWVDPDLVADPDITHYTPDAELTTSITELSAIGVASYQLGGEIGQEFGGTVDHLRLSDSSTAYTDVTGAVIPEPASLVLMGTGTLLVLRRRR